MGAERGEDAAHTKAVPSPQIVIFLTTYILCFIFHLHPHPTALFARRERIMGRCSRENDCRRRFGDRMPLGNLNSTGCLSGEPTLSATLIFDPSSTLTLRSSRRRRRNVFAFALAVAATMPIEMARADQVRAKALPINFASVSDDCLASHSAGAGPSM